MGIFNRKKPKEENKKGVLTLYSVTGDTSGIYEAAKKEFLEHIKAIEEIEDGKSFILKDGTTVDIHLNADENYVKVQKDGMANFFSQAPLENKEVLKHVMMQIKLFTCITNICFEITSDTKRTSFLVNAIYKIAEDSQSLVLHPTMELYTAEGKLLISIKGETDFQEYYPIASSSILKRGIKASPKDEARYKRIIEECDQNKIPHTSFMLGTQIMEEEVVVPTIREIAERAVAVFCCGLKGECLLMEGGSIELSKREVEAIENRYDLKNSFTSLEKAYIEDEKPDRMTAIQFSWQYERCSVLMWALGLTQLNPPTEICKVGEIAQILRSYESLEALMGAASLRSKEELLDMHTKILYYHWACVEARIKNEAMPANLDSGVVMEQHHALNWLIGANGACGWDDISANT